MLIALLFCSGCAMSGSGDHAGSTTAATPSPAETSFVSVETEPETPAPVPTPLPADINTTTVSEPALPSPETLESGPNKQAYPYVIRSMSQFLYYNTYLGVVDYLRQKYPDRSVTSVSEHDYRQYVSDPVQDSYIDGFVENIQKRSDLPQERARIAISLIQHIPYSASSGMLYPYEVLYYNKGGSGDKSLLAAHVLSEMGYGTALLVYVPERHVALGLKCPKQYSTAGSGYCFVETTHPAIMTYCNGTYSGVSKPVSKPIIVPIADGNSFDQIAEEYTDAGSYDAALACAVTNSTGIYMDRINYDIYGNLRQKYGLFDLDLVKVR
jgi:hypothetical protein